MQYPKYKVDVLEFDNKIRITGMVLTNKMNGNYMKDGLIINKNTISEFINQLNNKDNIISGKLKEIKIDNGYDDLEFEYKGTEMEPAIYVFNNKYIDDNDSNGAFTDIPLEPLWHEDVMKYIDILVNELKKHV